MAASTVINDDSLFGIVPILPPTTTVTITTAPQIKLFSKAAGAYVNVDSSNYIVAAVGDVFAATTWDLGHPSSTYYTLKNNATAKFASADSYGNGAVIVNRDYPSVPGWETFTFIAQPNNAYSIQVCLLFTSIRVVCLFNYMYRLMPIVNCSPFSPMVDSLPLKPTLEPSLM